MNKEVLQDFPNKKIQFFSMLTCLLFHVHGVDTAPGSIFLLTVVLGDSYLHIWFHPEDTPVLISLYSFTLQINNPSLDSTSNFLLGMLTEPSIFLYQWDRGKFYQRDMGFLRMLHPAYTGYCFWVISCQYLQYACWNPIRGTLHLPWWPLCVLPSYILRRPPLICQRLRWRFYWSNRDKAYQAAPGPSITFLLYLIFYV